MTFKQYPATLRRHYSGTIVATGDKVGFRGLEHFTGSVAADGSRTLSCVCELPDRSLSKNIVYSVDRDFRPIDCYVRLIKDGSLLGTGWFLFKGNKAEYQGFNIRDGRMSQHIERDTLIPSFGPHPLVGDILHLASYDHESGEKVQYIDSYLSSLAHDGGTGPLLEAIHFGIEFLGEVEVTVPAGTFMTHHYRFHLEGSLPQEHPLEELWCLPEDFVFVKIRVGEPGAGTTYELTELDY